MDANKLENIYPEQPVGRDHRVVRYVPEAAQGQQQGGANES